MAKKVDSTDHYFTVYVWWWPLDKPHGDDLSVA